ncbi:hypothetical protein JXB31_05210 [Candidatus Woesearchaeota archaeon]|nr:hypothetical protein [Candidatus Woesearchaeota archaeon]
MLNIEGALAEVVVFSNYETHTTLSKDSLHIERVVTLKNVGANPIIPGELHFKLHEIEKGNKIPSRITGFSAKNDYNTELKTRTIEGEEETDLVISVWEPVLPKFSYRITLEYDLMFKSKGFMFYELSVPVEETTIPIENNKHNLYLPKSNHVTYAPNAVLKTVSRNGEEYKMVSWENRDDMFLEYSRLPLPKLGIKAVNIFWGIVIVAMLVLTFLIHKKMKRK